MNRFKAVLALATLPLLAATNDSIPANVQASFDAFRPDAVKAHIRFLSSDLLEGRGPGTRGDQLAQQYIAAQFEAMGLPPNGDNGTYFQKVSLLGIETAGDKTSLSFEKSGAPTIGPLKYLDQFVGGNQTQNEVESLDSELVFVGHGVVAPEYKWDDYKGLDTRGKTLVMLVDDPPANAKEPDLFKGRTRTYYGRWTYKYETGTAKNAQAVLLIHTDASAGYGWKVVRNSWSGESSYVKRKEGDPAVRFAGWLTESAARDLFRAAGQDLDALTRAAASRNFKPVSLGYRIKGTVTSKLRPFDTANVVARLEGSDPQLKNEAVLYTAHHDHLGIATADEKGDTIYNGAIDNASGVATVLEIARVWSQAPRPRRSIVFAAVAAEEQGLLGSEFYGQHPTIPAGKIALGINLDALYLFGKVKDVVMIGSEKTTFYPTVQRIANAMGLTITPDQAPEQGSYYRSDHFSFAKAGIPSFSIKQGHDIVGKPEAWGVAQAAEYRDKRYHQPSDEFDPNWDFSAAAQIGQLSFWLGSEAANQTELPNWPPGEEFRAARDASQKQ
ncbi:MAG TPA: M28 family peptidase [Thermoanaerobaculia bacterium]|nr:M28 family peptidase [Thermoanaerobaculia bacterium]